MAATSHTDQQFFCGMGDWNQLQVPSPEVVALASNSQPLPPIPSPSDSSFNHGQVPQASPNPGNSSHIQAPDPPLPVETTPVPRTSSQRRPAQPIQKLPPTPKPTIKEKKIMYFKQRIETALGLMPSELSKAKASVLGAPNGATDTERELWSAFEVLAKQRDVFKDRIDKLRQEADAREHELQNLREKKKTQDERIRGLEEQLKKRDEQLKGNNMKVQEQELGRLRQIANDYHKLATRRGTAVRIFLESSFKNTLAVVLRDKQITCLESRLDGGQLRQNPTRRPPPPQHSAAPPPDVVNPPSRKRKLEDNSEYYQACYMPLDPSFTFDDNNENYRALYVPLDVSSHSFKLGLNLPTEGFVCWRLSAEQEDDVINLSKLAPHHEEWVKENLYREFTAAFVKLHVRRAAAILKDMKRENDEMAKWKAEAEQAGKGIPNPTPGPAPKGLVPPTSVPGQDVAQEAVMSAAPFASSCSPSRRGLFFPSSSSSSAAAAQTLSPIFGSGVGRTLPLATGAPIYSSWNAPRALSIPRDGCQTLQPVNFTTFQEMSSPQPVPAYAAMSSFMSPAPVSEQHVTQMPDINKTPFASFSSSSSLPPSSPSTPSISSSFLSPLPPPFPSTSSFSPVEVHTANPLFNSGLNETLLPEASADMPWCSSISPSYPQANVLDFMSTMSTEELFPKSDSD